jgi:hypothetical protein
MIDYATYKLMHPHDPKKNPQVVNEDDLGPDVMAHEEPPADDSFLLCLPNSIPGFNMNKKEWSKIRVSKSVQFANAVISQPRRQPLDTSEVEYRRF